MTDKNTLIKNIFADLGITEVGFCAFSAVKNALLECRAKARLPKNAKTVILCLFPYKIKEQPPENLSRYAAVPDYHPIVLNYLGRAAEIMRAAFPENRFECFADNSPIPEVFAAATAGLGKKGENGLLINEKYGSFCFIGEIVSDLRLSCDNLFQKCSGCGKCKEVCPVGGDQQKCLSAVSQKKGELDEREREQLFKNGILWGCDICAEICPENRGKLINPIPELEKGYRDGYHPDECPENRPYSWRGKGVIKRNFEIIN